MRTYLGIIQLMVLHGSGVEWIRKNARQETQAFYASENIIVLKFDIISIQLKLRPLHKFQNRRQDNVPTES